MSDRDDKTGAWKLPPSRYFASRPATFRLPERPFSCYVAMRDGCRIAVDVYLPQGAVETKFAAIVVSTPYYRRFKTDGPVAEYSPMAGRYRDCFVPRGYAMVVMDVRGTGASFGTRDAFRSPKERDDYGEIVAWIVAQPWSNGAVGATGISYPGAASLFLASTGHPAVKAIAPLFAVSDVYADQLYPGGMVSKIWTGHYNDCIVALDHDRGEELKKYAYFGEPGLRGPMPVDEDPDGKLLGQAMAEHRNNFNLADAAPEFAFRDEGLLHDPSQTLATFSPYSYYDGIAEDVAIYSVSGWYDGSGYANGAISRFLTRRGPNDFLLLGPWDHGARANISPWREEQASQFNLFGEVLRFFDQYLLGRETGMAGEPRVRFYSLHAEEWQSSNEWPPVKDTERRYLKPGGIAPEPEPRASEATYRVDFNVDTGRKTRFERLGLLAVDAYYADWHGRDAKMLNFTSEPFDAPTELSGHAVAHINLSIDETDAAVFVYLGEVDDKGRTHYVTEGMLRALHRKTTGELRNYAATWPLRTYARGDASPVERGKPFTMVIPLLPVSWVFPRGSRLRVSIAGADSLHFAQVPHGRPPLFRIACGGTEGSYLDLPLKRKP